jgi:predicted phage tail protein
MRLLGYKRSLRRNGWHSVWLMCALVVLPVNVQAQSLPVPLAWDAALPADNVTGYFVGYVEVASSTTTCPTNGDTDTFVPVSPPITTTFSLTTLTAGKTYCLRLYAINANGRSNASNTVGPVIAKTSTVPSPPTNFRLTLVTTTVGLVETLPDGTQRFRVESTRTEILQ